MTTTVSAAITTGGPPPSAAAALRRAKSSASAAGSRSQGTEPSSKSERTTVTSSPRPLRSSRRRGDCEASATAVSRLLIDLAADLHEAGCVPHARIAMRPVNHWTNVVERKFPFDDDRVAAMQRRSLGDGNVVGDQHGHALAVAAHLDDETLVIARGTGFGGQHARDWTLHNDFRAAAARRDCAQGSRIVRRR